MTEFIKAADLRNKYHVMGRFYILLDANAREECRSLLTISDTTTKNKKKLLVVMLNPGSSRPIDNEYFETEILATKIDQLNSVPLIKARPDTTQYQIMRVMSELQFTYADIINLYDNREAKSGLFFEKAKKGKLHTVASIFSDERQSELRNYFTTDTTVILAWGNAKPIAEIECKAINRISKLTNKVFAVRGNDNIICHPSPQNHNLKLKWLENIYGQLKGSGQRIFMQA